MLSLISMKNAAGDLLAIREPFETPPCGGSSG